MKRCLCLTLAILLLCAACTPALAASLPAKAKTAIAEAGWEGYKAVTTITYGKSSPSLLVFSLMRKGDQNLLCALMYDSEAQAYELLAANEHILPPGKITPKLRYKGEARAEDKANIFSLDYSIKKPAAGQPARVSLEFEFSREEARFYLDSAEITYTANKDGIAVQDVLSGSGTDMIFFTRLKVDKRGDVKATSGSHTLSREGQNYHLPSFSLEQAQRDIELVLIGISNTPPEPDYKMTTREGALVVIVRGYYAINEEGFKTKPKGEVTIPAEIGGFPVVSIEKSAYGDYGGITKLTIPEGVESIGEYSFDYCRGLTDVIVPESVTGIGRDAFKGCDNVVFHVKPGSYAEQYARLNGINYNNGIEGKDARWTYELENGEAILTGYWGMLEGDVTIPGEVDGFAITGIGDSALMGYKRMTSVVVPDGLTAIGDNAFFMCGGLTSVIIPDSVTVIGERAFRYCKNLTSIALPKDVTSIGEEAFSYCSSLTKVAIPSGVTSIGDWMFEECSGLTEVTVPASVTSIGKRAFDERRAILTPARFRLPITLHVEEGSYAEQYAKDNGIAYVYGE